MRKSLTAIEERDSRDKKKLVIFQLILMLELTVFIIIMLRNRLSLFDTQVKWLYIIVISTCLLNELTNKKKRAPIIVLSIQLLLFFILQM